MALPLANHETSSAHPSINQMRRRLDALGIPTAFDHHAAQQPICTFGSSGVCCQLCSHGPCRITARADRGICGMTADGIVARNLLRLASHGVAAYSYQLEMATRTLRATGQGLAPYRIADEAKLRRIAGALGLDASRPAGELAAALADFVDAELAKPAHQPLRWVEVFSPPSRVARWRELGILPGGVHAELRNAMTRSMTSIDTDPTDLLVQSMRLSITNAFTLEATVELQDVVLGSPRLLKTEADLGVLDPSTVNVVAHGHIPWMGTAVLDLIETPEVQAKARAAGATGVKLYGSMDTGQELLQRFGDRSPAFGGQLGNWLAQEFWAATGAVDLVMLDYNCTTPNLARVAERFHTELVPVSDVVRLTGAAAPVDYAPEKAREQAAELIDRAIAAFGRRREAVEIPSGRSAVVAGFGLETIAGALGGTLTPLLDAVKAGTVKGIAAVVGCTNTRNGHDTTTLAITRELIARDILVLSGGCVASAHQMGGLMRPEAAAEAGPKLRGLCEALGIPPVLNFGSCVDIGRITLAATAIAGALGVDPSQLPVVVSAPEYLEQKAVSDGFFAVAYGLYTHLGPLPPVAGGPTVTQILTADVEGLTGGKVAVEQDPAQAAAAMEAHVLAKRAALGI